MRTTLAVLLGRLARALLRLRGGGSAVPGHVALFLAPRFLAHAVSKLPGGVVFVSASNGKSTTTQMLVAILRAHGMRVFTSASGGNLPQGVASSMLPAVGLDGILRDEIAVLEVDEGYGSKLMQQLPPHSVLLVNLQVDQLNRFHEPDRVYGMLKAFAAKADRNLVVNADDHNLVRMAGELSGSATVSSFALAPELRAVAPWLARGDNPALADAGSRGLDPAVTVVASSGLAATLAVGDREVEVRLPARGLHYAVDAAAATAMATALLGDRLDPAAVAAGLSAMAPVYGRGEVLRHRGEDIEILMMKNPPSFQVNVDALEGPPEQLFVAVDEGTPDPSWVYGSDLSKIDHVDVITGTKAWQFATRFRYDDIPVGEVIPELGPALDRFLALPKPAHGMKVMLVNYEQMMTIRKRLGYLDMEVPA